ncbi:TetR/AcrR family transcriptional regulator [Corynebacterium terpenotabidum]|uniref:TetR family transcriptional regulator n=1 Tax=Corynebacterium terpenotabidum Y-11 TaxID=1200352 RepID=S4XCV0_9CORY|nr:TetR/AcrR family transcriptional regulator [Corynebacterium terpenotabidum]AGP30354.1 TetR family transcriptional regulator [Corynebacterium terpenotabidum Y-11]
MTINPVTPVTTDELDWNHVAARLEVLPDSFRRYGCSIDEYRLILDTALPELVRSGLEASTGDIAVGAGVPADHPLLSDVEVLYDEALRYSFRLLWPRPSDMDVENLAPAEAVRTLVRTAYWRHRENPDAVRLILTENIQGHARVPGRPEILESSPVVLQIDRVLMRGQDFGAFRPGVSAEDVYVLITSLCTFPSAQGTTFHGHYATDVDYGPTVDGLELLACDAVLSFLTTSMPTSQGSSYTHSSPAATTPGSVSASLYSAGDGDRAVDSEDTPAEITPWETTTVDPWSGVAVDSESGFLDQLEYREDGGAADDGDLEDGGISSLYDD